jgi:hypothetical protein
MENYYKRIVVKTIDDLPKKGRYLAKFDRHLMPSIIQYCDYDDTMKDQWVSEVDWYFQPCNEKIEALEELCTLQGELINIYAKEVPTKNYLNLSDRESYNELRQKISELESKLKEV